MYDYEILENQTTESAEQKEMPSFNHSYLCWQIIQQISQNKDVMALPELTLDIGKGMTPDISVYPKNKYKPNFLRDIQKFPEMPMLAIEIISPSQNPQELLEKAAVFVQNGVKEIWTIEPYAQTIFITTENGDDIVHNEAVESCGIRVDFKQIFEGN